MERGRHSSSSWRPEKRSPERREGSLNREFVLGVVSSVVFELCRPGFRVKAYRSRTTTAALCGNKCSSGNARLKVNATLYQ